MQPELIPGSPITVCAIAIYNYQQKGQVKWQRRKRERGRKGHIYFCICCTLCRGLCQSFCNFGFNYPKMSNTSRAQSACQIIMHSLAKCNATISIQTIHKHAMYNIHAIALMPYAILAVQRRTNCQIFVYFGK